MLRLSGRHGIPSFNRGLKTRSRCSPEPTVSSSTANLRTLKSDHLKLSLLMPTETDNMSHGIRKVMGRFW